MGIRKPKKAVEVQETVVDNEIVEGNKEVSEEVVEPKMDSVKGMKIVAQSADEVLKLNNEGTVLLFQEDWFKSQGELFEHEVRLLNKTNKTNYLLAKDQAYRNAASRNKTVPIEAAFLEGQDYNADKRLEYRKKPGIHTTFKRPDEVRSCEDMGFKTVGVKTTYRGEPELIEMEYPEEKFNAHMKAVCEKSRRNMGASKNAFNDKVSTIAPNAEVIDT